MDDLLVPIGLLSHPRPGAIVTITRNDGTEYRGRVISSDNVNARVHPFEKLAMAVESPLTVTLIQALPSREKMTFIIQKATELGVSRIIPCTTLRSEDPNHHRVGQDKSHRWQAVAKKAVEQCRRRVMPMITDVMSFEDAVASIPTDYEVKVILYEKEPKIKFKDLAASQPEPTQTVLVSGPEGGFAEDEIRLAQYHGFVPVRLGGRIMRCETAALAALSIVQYMWGDL
jgi:16S rRNA (uracil1498-N3)-methyltransferase